MKPENIAVKLADLTSALHSPVPENAEQLEQIRSVLGYNLRAGLQDIAGGLSAPGSVRMEKNTDTVSLFEKYAQQKISDKDNSLVRKVGTKQHIPVVEVQTADAYMPVNLTAAGGEFRWNQKVADRIGPYISETGQELWFNLYYYEDKLTVRSKDNGQAYFLFSRAQRQTWVNHLKRNAAVQLREGHVWIRARLFSASAAEGEYVGFRISSGSFSISNKKKWDGDFLDFDGDFTGKLTLTLEQPEDNSASMDGCAAAQDITFRYPETVTFEWKNGKLIHITAGNGSFKGYGNNIILSDFSLPVEYPAGLQHLLIPCKVQPDKWNAAFATSQVFSAVGEAPVTNAYWALPLVKVANPDTLAEPENNGGYALRLGQGIRARWIGSDAAQPDALPAKPMVLLYPKALLFYSEKTAADIDVAKQISQQFACWEITETHAGRIPLDLVFRKNFPLAYYCHAEDGESLWVGGEGALKADRPVYVDGSLMKADNLLGWVAFSANGSGRRIGLLMARAQSLKEKRKLLALENALLAVSQPLQVFITGTLSTINPNWIDNGNLLLGLGLVRWRPILPDPYVSNTQPGWNRNILSGQEINFLGLIYAQVKWATPADSVVSFGGQLPASAAVGVKPASDPEIRPAEHPGANVHTSVAAKKQYVPDPKNKKKKKEIDDYFNNLEKALDGWKLLDVSTNKDLIGVSMPLYRAGQQSSAAVSHQVLSGGMAGAPFVMQQMAVHTPLSGVHVFTVPQVQWEPVRTLPEDQFPEPLIWFPEHLASATDGGPTRLLGLSQQLSPIIPDVVAYAIKDNFAAGAEAAALTTLSFGLKAVFRLHPVNTAQRNADKLDIMRPDFTQKEMKGGLQVHMLAESGHAKDSSRSPGFDGAMAQTLNGYDLYSGLELYLSVLGDPNQVGASVEAFFNNEFAPGGSAPFVPVTRFDISGYGGSNFSDWDNPQAFAQVGKAQFRIMVGRTSFEMIKVVSKIYPWGITVTRSVTIERRSNAGVVRKDSGWQAADSGIFDFRTKTDPGQPYTFRPGAFRGCFNIKNIRPASSDILEWTEGPDDIAMAPVYFDADVQIDGQENGNTFSKGILGFIQVKPQGHPISTAAFRSLINRQGAIGGPIDTMLNIGGSGFRFRATRFEVDVTDNGGTSNFVAMVKGQPVLPKNGSWSVVKMAAPGNTADPQEAETADSSKGTPLFIENSWQAPSSSQMGVSAPSGPYRFADTADLFAAQPRYDYGFLQNTGSQAFIFRRPTIAQGAHEIASSLKPAFADPFAMLTSKGVFPPISNAIEFPSSSYKLQVQPGTGKLRLNSAVDWTNLRSPLVVTRDGTDEIAIEYDASRLKFTLNYDNWNIELNEFFIWTSLMNISKFTGTRFSLRAGTQQQSRLVNVQTRLKPEIQEALKFLPGMGAPTDVGDINLGMTNAKHEVKVHTAFQKEFKLSSVVKLTFSGSAGVDSELDTSRGTWLAFFGASVGAELQGRIPVGGIFFVVLGLELEVAFRSASSPAVAGSSGGFKSLEISAYVGIGVGGHIGPFEASAFIAVGIVFVYEDNTAKLGGLVKLEAEVDLKIVSIEIYAELKGVIYKGDDPDTMIVEPDATLCDASGEVGVNISICFIFSIHASYSYQTTKRL